VLLMMLKCDEVTPRAQVARDLAVPAEELGALLDPLHAEGLLRQTGGGGIALTDAGERTLAHLWPVVGRADRQALAFPVWRVLAVEQGLTDAESADLMGRLVAAARHRVRH
jgi:hypothetical protein